MTAVYLLIVDAIRVQNEMFVYLHIGRCSRVVAIVDVNSNVKK